MKTTLQKWGNSLAVRIPKTMANEIKLEQGDSVELDVTDGTLSVRPARPNIVFILLHEPPRSVLEGAGQARETKESRSTLKI